MSKVKLLTASVLFVLTVQPSFADDASKFVGIWRLLTYEAERQGTGTWEPVWGQNPTGYLILTPEGRMMVMMSAEGQETPKTVEEAADLLTTMTAYTGTYRVEGDKWITKVDAAWIPQWVGTEQPRSFKVEGDRLHLVTQQFPFIAAQVPAKIRPNWPEKGVTRFRNTWERVK
jgi:hypothetical protein